MLKKEQAEAISEVLTARSAATPPNNSLSDRAPLVGFAVGGFIGWSLGIWQTGSGTPWWIFGVIAGGGLVTAIRTILYLKNRKVRKPAVAESLPDDI